MRSIVIKSTENDMMNVYKDLCEQIDAGDNGNEPILIVFSADINMFSFISKKLHVKYEGVKVIGSTSFLNFSSLGYENITASALVIYSGIQCNTGVLLDISTNPKKHVKEISGVLDYFEDRENICCIEFTSAFLNCEEIVQDTFESVLKYNKIPLIGSSAGSPNDDNRTLVTVDGITYEEACVFVFIKNLNGKIHLFKENLFRSTGHKFKVSDVNCDKRTVYEYNHFPAASVIAEALHTSMEELQEKVRTHPVGQIIGDEIYIADVDKIYEDGKISYFSRIYNHTEVIQLEADDVDEVWEKTANDIKSKCATPAFSIVINSSSRTKYFMQREIFDRFNGGLTNVLNIFLGFSGYGEQIDYIHQNQTMLVIVFE